MGDAYSSVFRPDLFAERTVIVTGGGSGIGRCVAHELASLGAHVAITGRKQEKLDRVAAEIAEDGGSVSTAVFDIRDEAAVTAAVASVVEKRGRIDGLVNNAGGQFPSGLADMSRNGFEAVVRTNLVGGFLVAREVFRQSMRKNGGAIVNMTADFWGGMPGMGHSGAARAGMDNFTKSAAVEWAAYGVRVNAVAPGLIASSGFDTYDNPVIREMLLGLKEKVPLQRFATEAEVSAAICFLLSDAAAYVTGANLRIDGGNSLSTGIWPREPARNERVYDGFHRYRRPRMLDEDDP